jgi:predicted enzyme related to lactoylglutathione lyase
MASLASMLLSSTDPERLRTWYARTLRPEVDDEVENYRMLRFDGFYLMIDSRDDVTGVNREPGRMILNFDVDDARATVRRMDEVGTGWLTPLEDRDGSLFATAVDPDGNYVQIIQLSEAHKAEMSASQQP